MTLEIRHRTRHEVCATWGAIVIRICDGVRTELEDMFRVKALFDELLEQRAAIGMLLVYTHGTPLPTTAVQRYAISSMRELDGKLVLSVAMLGLGFWASSFRATLDVVARAVSGGTLAMEGSVEAATQRLCAELIGNDPEALLAVYHQLAAGLESGGLLSTKAS